MHLNVVLAGITAGLLLGAEKPGAVRSGPRVGTRLSPFHALSVTEGKKIDYVGEVFGRRPAILIFARQVNAPLANLAKKLDHEVARNAKAGLNALVVILSEEEGVEGRLKKLGETQGFKNVHLAVLSSSGLPRYQLVREADVTVVLSKDGKVQVNHAFRRGELDEKAVASIRADLPKILGK